MSENTLLGQDEKVIQFQVHEGTLMLLTDKGRLFEQYTTQKGSRSWREVKILCGITE